MREKNENKGRGEGEYFLVFRDRREGWGKDNGGRREGGYAA